MSGYKRNILFYVAAIAFPFLCNGNSEIAFSEKIKEPEIKLTMEAPLPLTLHDVMTATPEEIEHFDIAAMNLACAEGLPGAENMDSLKLLLRLSAYTQWAANEIKRHAYRYNQAPEEYANSKAYFMMLYLSLSLQDFGVHYNPELIEYPEVHSGTFDPSFASNSQDILLHGLLDEDRAGTCSSMPVLITAIGRRLGFPLYLVTNGQHAFVRWDDEYDRFNFEATSVGSQYLKDEDMRKRIPAIEPWHEKAFGFMKSKSKLEELSMFLEIRAVCLYQHNRYSEAKAALNRAAELAPKNWNPKNLLSRVNDSYKKYRLAQIDKEYQQLNFNKLLHPQYTGLNSINAEIALLQQKMEISYDSKDEMKMLELINKQNQHIKVPANNHLNQRNNKGLTVQSRNNLLIKQFNESQKNYAPNFIQPNKNTR